MSAGQWGNSVRDYVQDILQFPAAQEREGRVLFSGRHDEFESVNWFKGRKNSGILKFRVRMEKSIKASAAHQQLAQINFQDLQSGTWEIYSRRKVLHSRNSAQEPWLYSGLSRAEVSGEPTEQVRSQEVRSLRILDQIQQPRRRVAGLVLLRMPVRPRVVQYA